MAILEKAEVISPIVDSNGSTTSAGTVSAGYQNFFICIEMLFAAIALRYAFPYQVNINKSIYLKLFSHTKKNPYRFIHVVVLVMLMAVQLQCSQFQAV